MSAIGTKRMPTGLIQINADLVRRWYAPLPRDSLSDIETTPAMMAKDAHATFVSARFSSMLPAWLLLGNSMGYITKVLRPDEKLLATGKLHWIVYRLAIISMLVAVVLWFVIGEAVPILRMTAFVLFAGFAVLIAIKEWLEQWITEIAVTDRRVIYKTGLIRRQTAEMNMDKIESVKVDQSLLGRLLNYGSIHIRGTGEGLEHLDYISSPISLRNAITTK